MKHRIKNTLRAMSAHIGIKVCLVDYFDDQTHGKLLVRERRILLNANKPRVEHIFTLLHEIGHFINHYQNPPRDYCPGYLRKDWKLAPVNRIVAVARRSMRLALRSSAGREWEADLWAMCAFVLLAKKLECQSVLVEFLERHPEKWGLFMLAIVGFLSTRVKKQMDKNRNILRQLTA